MSISRYRVSFVMSYGGDITPNECWEMLEAEPGAILVDVRTRPEWAFVGVPKLSVGMQEMVLREWQVFPDMQVDQEFAQAIAEEVTQRGGSTQTSICFLCRSGVRSLAAARALTAVGYANTYNVTGGFEGGLDEDGHRGNEAGWKVDGLPWRQP